jgi:hypothetical protein
MRPPQPIQDGVPLQYKGSGFCCCVIWIWRHGARVVTWSWRTGFVAGSNGIGYAGSGDRPEGRRGATRSPGGHISTTNPVGPKSYSRLAVASHKIPQADEKDTPAGTHRQYGLPTCGGYRVRRVPIVPMGPALRRRDIGRRKVRGCISPFPPASGAPRARPRERAEDTHTGGFSCGDRWGVGVRRDLPRAAACGPWNLGDSMLIAL